MGAGAGAVAETIQVAVRVRPFNARELAGAHACVVSMQDNVTTVDTSAGPRPFGFDRCYWSHDNFAESDDGVLIPASDSSPYASQQHIFEDLGATLVTNVLAGYNACAMAYGQTSAGKSYTMIGTPTNPGLVPRLCAALFAAPVPNKVQRQVTLSMLEIYNEQINDLLASSTALHECRVRQHPKQGFFVEGLTRVPVNDHADVQARMQVGTKLRTTAATNMNKTSSRSHMVVTLHVKQTQVNGKGESTTKTSDIHLVDLAGSERTDLAGTSDQRFKEGLAINQSLSNLGNVIAALADQATTIPYRNSVLTKLLSNALGGNSRTMMIANISPSPLNLEETLSTLRFADRAKRIKCKAVVNESPTDKLIRELKEENQRLLDMLKAAGSDADSDALRADKAEVSRNLADLEQAWTTRIASAQQQWQQQGADQEADATLEQHPHLSNINPDPQLTHVVKHILLPGSTPVGKAIDATQYPNNIYLQGPTIAAEHGMFVREDLHVFLDPSVGATTHVNGQLLTQRRRLAHLDRIIFSPTHCFVFIEPRGHDMSHQDSAAAVNLDSIDYEYMQLELAAAQGMGDMLVGRSPSTLSMTPEAQQLRQALLQTAPLITQAKAISVEVGLPTQFEMFVRAGKAHALTDSSKEVMIQVTNMQTLHTWHWTADVFEERFYVMQDIYNAHQAGDADTVRATLEKNNPFVDTLEPVFLGSAHVFLQPLAYGIDIEERLPVSNYRGVTVGELEMHVALCSAKGVPNEGFEHVRDPSDLLEGRMDIMVKIKHAERVDWLNEDPSRGVLCRFRFYTDARFRETRIVHNKQPAVFKYHKQFTLPKATQNLLNYLQTNALVIELWGAQGQGTPSTPGRGASARSPQAPPLSPPSDSRATDEELDKIVAHSAWTEERRRLQDTIHKQQQEIDFLHIEKSVLVREATRANSTLRSTLGEDLNDLGDYDIDLTEAATAFVQAERRLFARRQSLTGQEQNGSLRTSVENLHRAHREAGQRLMDMVQAALKRAEASLSS